jgi:hypothetical protein
MTGGRSSHGSGKKWEEKDVQGQFVFVQSNIASFTQGNSGLVRLRDNLLAQLQELNRSKSRGKADENIIAEITRLESAITVTKDDLVRISTLCILPPLDRSLMRSQSAFKLRHNGTKDELKHVERELKKLAPDFKKVSKQPNLLLSRSQDSPPHRLKLRMPPSLRAYQRSNQLLTKPSMASLPLSAPRSASITSESMKNVSSEWLKKRVKHEIDSINRLRA